MKVRKFQDAKEFYARIQEYLLQQEALHNLLLGICHTLIHHPERFDETPYLATVESDGEIVAVAMKTPPRPLLLSKITDFQAVDLLAQDLYLSDKLLSGVNAPTEESQAFVAAWHSLTAQSYQLALALRTFQLQKVQNISPVTGYLRLATENDKELLVKWHEAFSLEALGKIETDSQRWAEWIFKQQKAYLWQDEVPVCIACWSEVTPHRARIGMVYTPPEYRRRGYASACIAALSQTLLNQGNQFCFLFTDLANPTSNHIYQEIGYQPVGDWQQYSFVSD
ncbi:GNAT family N-acetyltransferase [Nostoc sp. FACHB-152]|uniref:GNAT family N-acetyltransferase n=1 Tax=unclassified Nostoc TaxID=2593658 RepID=UPI001686DA0C|nr:MULTISPECIES: GNAT family N-acetyltransferase [unclassified Nostoc]MBD2450472.1 GNAT family N-acetyltransferase [Nostoc sp. FACHB-152]MBD2471693.1 GNAT family N-acetyltransferase [Nostoc sp. FACHB-145]